MTKQLLRLFGFPFHDAPGEAEAECALLQKQGIVDAVLSEDVDTLMFGSTLCLRNWTAEGAKGNKSPTHVDVYRSARTKEASGLDSEGMILVALMSGGDYIQAGIDSCGIKTACQAARAGFGTELCSIGIGGEEALDTWRRRLQHEIRTNEVSVPPLSEQSCKILHVHYCFCLKSGLKDRHPAAHMYLRVKSLLAQLMVSIFYIEWILPEKEKDIRDSQVFP